jgi:hypothetical protein
VAALAAGIYFKGHYLIGLFDASPNPGVVKMRIEEPKELIKKDPPIAGEEFSRAIAVEFEKVPESESAEGLNATVIWNVHPYRRTVGRMRNGTGGSGPAQPV